MIRLYVREGRPGTHASILSAIPSPYHRSIDIEWVAKVGEIPKAAAFVLHCGQGRPTTAAEGFAASRGSYITCLPEAMGWFQRKLDDHLAANEDTVILDAGLHKILRVF